MDKKSKTEAMWFGGVALGFVIAIISLIYCNPLTFFMGMMMAMFVMMAIE